MSTKYFYVIAMADSVAPGVTRTVSASGTWDLDPAKVTRDEAYAQIKALQCREFGLASNSPVLFFSLEKNSL